jgi:glyoxylase-like metal-dependent hydrolase (beta-lactamase superfamily II)
MLYRYIEDLRFKIEDFRIIATHGHLDHLWGAKWATEQWHTPVLMHEADIPMAQAMQQQYDLFGVHRTAEGFPIEDIKSSILNLKSQMSNFELLETPGHTPGSICLYWPEEKVLLSGDTLFQMGYGRTDLPGGNMGQLIESLEHLFTLPADTVVYPGHGAETTIGEERR